MTRSDDEPRGPKLSERTEAEKAARQARLAEEMRKNLRKRKEQQRARRRPPER
ncbi:MAG TPA: hypothetical protein VFO09_08645 [Methyloceanibacter sp.]|nr:hypothetical protein [Methyloceanibacter sp.]